MCRLPHHRPASGTSCRLGALAAAVVAATTVVSAAQLSAPPPPAPKEAKAPAAPVEPEGPAEPVFQTAIELVASRPIVRAMVNGQGPFAFLIDPLAPRMVIDQTLAEALELKALPGTAGRTEVRVDLRLGPSDFPGVLADVSSTGRLIAEIGPAGQPRGILNTSLWKDQLVTVDLGRHTLRVDPGTLPAPDDKEVFALLEPSGDLVVPLRVSGQSIACHVDPKASHGLLLPAAYFPRVETQASTRTASKIPMGGATIPGQEARLVSTVTVAAFDFDRPYVEFGAIGERAVLGNRWLTDFAFTYDVGNRRVRLARASRP